VGPAVPRSIARLQYAAARLPFTLLDEWVVARYWDQDALVRTGFERWLGSLDVVAGRLLGDDAISRRGLALMRRTGDPAQSGRPGQVPPEVRADDQAPEAFPAEGQAPEALPADDQAQRPSRPRARPPEPAPGAASRAVLQALAEQVDDDPFDLFDRLASQLPGNLQTALLAREAAGPPLQLDAFYQRVSELAGVPPDQAEAYAREVVATLQKEVAGTPLEELFARLPREYRSLLPEQPHPGEAGDFLRRVQHLGELGSREEAETATRLTLSALGERISGGQAADLAAALPGELRPCLEQTAEPAQAFGIEEFLRRIADPQQTDPQTARRQAKAVLRAVREYTPGKEIADTVAQLPPDLASLLS
jgi:uncharacterized protein (DUF2267 family)